MSGYAALGELAVGELWEPVSRELTGTLAVLGVEQANLENLEWVVRPDWKGPVLETGTNGTTDTSGRFRFASGLNKGHYYLQIRTEDGRFAFAESVAVKDVE